LFNESYFYYAGFNGFDGSIYTAAGSGWTTEPPTPTKSGYNFIGWSLSHKGDIITFPYQPHVPNDLTLYAVWEIVECIPNTDCATILPTLNRQGEVISPGNSIRADRGTWSLYPERPYMLDWEIWIQFYVCDKYVREPTKSLVGSCRSIGVKSRPINGNTGYSISVPSGGTGQFQEYLVAKVTLERGDSVVDTWVTASSGAIR
jgi:uncharacterized repeat protein (TIGR02543 family)